MNRRDANLLTVRKRNLQSRLSRRGAYESPNYNLDYEVSARVRGTSHGGVAALLELARATGLSDAIDENVSVLREHRPYKESDHVLALVATVQIGRAHV